jgi:hypothetical protein
MSDSTPLLPYSFISHLQAIGFMSHISCAYFQRSLLSWWLCMSDAAENFVTTSSSAISHLHPLILLYALSACLHSMDPDVTDKVLTSFPVPHRQ